MSRATGLHCSKARCRIPRRSLFLIVSAILSLVVAKTVFRGSVSGGTHGAIQASAERQSTTKDEEVKLPSQQHKTSLLGDKLKIIVHKNYSLPSLKNGGIVLFVHIPKVGGTTVRELVKYRKNGRRSKVHYIYLTGRQGYSDTVEQMKHWVVHGTGGEVVFIEYHALDRSCPTLLHLSQNELPQWRRLTQESSVPFFAFSILRDPLSLAVSYFNFYHGIPQNPKRFDLLVPTKAAAPGATTQASSSRLEEIFVNATIANPQCVFLVHNEDAYTKTGQDLRESLTQQDCLAAQRKFLELFDWVGTTERIGNETLPLLRRLFSTNPHTQRLIRNLHHKAANQAGESAAIHLSDLSETTIQYIRSMTVWDQELYDAAKKSFLYP